MVKRTIDDSTKNGNYSNEIGGNGNDGCLATWLGPICGGGRESPNNRNSSSSSASVLSVDPPATTNRKKDPMMIDLTTIDEYDGMNDDTRDDRNNHLTINGGIDDDDEYVAEDRKANELIIQELNSLSIKDRERVYEDVHGVSPDDMMPEETSELLERCYLEFEEVIQQIPDDQRETYNLAQSIDKEYVQDKKLRLMFLRSEIYDCDKSARKFVKWFDWKLYCFGREKLCQRHIYLHDLFPETLKCIQEGWQQILPQRDNRGRAVFFCSTWRNTKKFPSVMAILQMFWYNMWSLLEDDNSQISGIVVITYLMGGGFTANIQGKEVQNNPTSLFDYKNHPMYDAFTKSPEMMNTMPWRLDACHFNLDSQTIYKPFMTIMKLSTDKHHRARMRVHYGSVTEVHYKLMSYGLPSTQLPLQNDGISIKHTCHLKWLKRRKIKEQWLMSQERQRGANKLQSQLSAFPGVELPSKYDVLLGRGQPINEHPGNRFLHDSIKKHRHEYDTAKGKGKKGEIAKRLVDMIQNGRGGRFLKRNDKRNGWWEEVSPAVALEKVCHGFRAKREDRNSTSIKDKSNRANEASSTSKRPKQILDENVQQPLASAAQQQQGQYQLQNQQQQQQQLFSIARASAPPQAFTGTNVRVGNDLTMMVEDNHGNGDQQDEGYQHVDGLIDDPALLMALPIVEDDSFLANSPPGSHQPWVDQEQNHYDAEFDQTGRDTVDHHVKKFNLDGGGICSPSPPPVLEDNNEMRQRHQIAQVSGGSAATTDGVGENGTDLLLELLVEQSQCFKCSPKVVMEWLQQMDIVSIGDLLEACSDADFVESAMVAHGGLKKFKLGPFVRAVQAAIVCN